jgi:hypothetical protein
VSKILVLLPTKEKTCDHVPSLVGKKKKRLSLKIMWFFSAHHSRSFLHFTRLVSNNLITSNCQLLESFWGDQVIYPRMSKIQVLLPTKEKTCDHVPPLVEKKKKRLSLKIVWFFSAHHSRSFLHFTRLISTFSRAAIGKSFDNF